MLEIREISSKTLLNKSSLSDFTLNCYVGCSHCCLYCYAGYIQKFKPRPEAWGDFVDVKVNALEALGRQIKRIKLPKEVFMSSICDGWQPLEAKYRLSRACLKLLLEAGLSVSILTKSSLIQRDFDILSAYKTPGLGMTLTTLNPGLQKVLEPYASSALERLNTLKKAQEKGIATWVFLGPLIPEFTDSEENLESLFQALKGLNLSKIYVDRLNLRWGVLGRLKRGLASYDVIKLKIFTYKTINSSRYLEYSHKLREKTKAISRQFIPANKLTFCF